jgi:hypothetical protein
MDNQSTTNPHCDICAAPLSEEEAHYLNGACAGCLVAIVAEIEAEECPANA